METAHTFCYKVGSTHNIASESVVTLPKSTMNCPDSSNWDKLNAFCMSVAFATRQIYAYFFYWIAKKLKDGAMFLNNLCIIFSCSVPQVNGTGGTHGTRLANYFQGIPQIECVQTGFLVPFVSLVSHIPRNGTRCRNPGRFCSATVSICIGCIGCDTSDTGDTTCIDGLMGKWML